MSGLDTIIRKIEEDGDATCAQIAANAADAAQKLANEADQTAKARTEEILAVGREKTSQVLAMAQSSADLQAKRNLLDAKGRLIRETLDKVKAAIASMNDETYFEHLVKLAVRFAEEGDCEMELCERDISRMPKDFQSTLNKRLGTGKRITAIKAGAVGEGGLRLIYEKITQNVTLEALIEENVDEIKDVLNRTLFD